VTNPAVLRRFVLRRYNDPTGISGDIAQGVLFPPTSYEAGNGAGPEDGVVALRWLTEWPTSVVFHDRGLQSVRSVHGHSGATRIIFLDPPDRQADRYGYADYQGAMADLGALVDICRTVVASPHARQGRERKLIEPFLTLDRHLAANYPEAT
jgi:hypothetical protein